MLIDAPFSRTGESKRDFDSTVTKPEYDRDIYIQTVVDLRRGVDLLLSRSDVDPKRIGFLGYSFGAHAGAILAGVEKSEDGSRHTRTWMILPFVKRGLTPPLWA